jgi:hypothetical protein
MERRQVGTGIDSRGIAAMASGTDKDMGLHL